MAMSPMMQEYCKTKEQYKDCILFYRLGDFYEMFFDDALLVTRELEITLTGKDCGLEERAPMCGVPYHAAETYINRLIERGHKVAICEQVEDPKKAKGLVKREVVRIVTPGTTLDAAALDETKNNYLMSIVSMEEHFGCAIADITTGDCFLTEVDKPQKLLDEINKFVPAEIICNDSFYMSNIDTDDLQNRLGICVFSLDSWYFDDELCRRTLKDHFHVGSLESSGSHCCFCLIQYPEKRTSFLFLSQGFHKFQISAAGTVDKHIFLCCIRTDSCHMGQGCLLGFFQI